MTRPEPTLQDFFLFTERDLAEEQRISLEATPRMENIRAALEKADKNIQWPLLKKMIVDHVDDLLGIKIKDILVGGWKTYRKLKESLDKDRHPADETILLPLADHTIKSSHKPSLKVLLNDKPLESIDFEIKLALKLKGVVLKIKGGRIREAHTGRCQGVGTLKCEGITLVDKKTKELALPGVIRLDGDSPPAPA